MQQHKRVVSLMDPAIDRESLGREGLTKYEVYRDMSFIEQHLVPGKKPQIFVLRPIGQYTFNNVLLAEDKESMRCQRAYEAALVRVENLRMRDGSQIPWAPDRAESGRWHLTQHELQMVSPYEVQEIGCVAWFASFLPHWIEVGYPLLPTPRAALDLVNYLRAAQSPADASPNSDEPSDSIKETAEAADSTAA